MKKLPGLFILLAVLASPLVLSLPLQEWLQHAGEWRTAAADLGVVAPLAFLAAAALATAAGLPRLVLCFLGGWLFGFGWGFTLSHGGTLAGAYGLFLLARRSTPERLLQRFPKLRSLRAHAGRGGWWMVLLARQLPIGGLYNDILLGWSRVSHRDFWIGSFLGFLPQGIAASLAGAGAIPAEPNRTAAYLALAAALFLFLGLSAKWAADRRQRLREEPA